MPGTPANANIGVVGLAVMGSNLARNLASREGNTVAVFNRSHEKTETLISEHPEAGFVDTTTYEEFAAARKLIASGLNDCQVARLTGIPRSTVR